MLDLIARLFEAFAGPAGVLGFAAVWIQNRKIRKEVSPNHGSSLNDSVRRTEKAVEQLQTDMRALVSSDREIRGLIGHEVGEDRRRLENIETHLFTQWRRRWRRFHL